MVIPTEMMSTLDEITLILVYYLVLDGTYETRAHCDIVKMIIIAYK